GTMETLLICPASRTEIVLGKFFTVMVFSVSMAILNLISMGVTGKFTAPMMHSGAFEKLGNLQPPSLGSLLWIAVLIIPLSALFSALCLALATFARSTKEGQYYLTPLLMVTMGLTLLCLAPGTEIEPFYSVMPVVGAALLLKEMLAHPESNAALYYGIPVLVTSIGYSLIALWWAIDQFSREDVLFREAERFELKLWWNHLLRDKEPTPSFAEAGICFAMIMFLQFGAMQFMQRAMAHVGMMQLLMIQQLVIIASPALFMAVMLTTDFRRTLRLKLPSLRYLSFALVLPFILHPISAELIDFLSEHFFPKFPASFERQLATMIDPTQPLWIVLLTFALAPAICEEIAFRGFILSGFGRSKRMWLAIGLTSLTFGLMHMIPQQVVNGALLGMVLGLIAVRSGSLLPSVVFHLIWNSLGVLHGRLGQYSAVQNVNESPWHWLVSFTGGKLHYDWPVLVLMTGLGGFLLWRLAKTSSATSAQLPPSHIGDLAEMSVPALEDSTPNPHQEKPMPTT
ncbi:MAG: CPBP family intramembrane metalloprotease, partial [Planctomycetaceae bacterium]|nr:CPBP family intramembrane metalloprotease [Planctomycetaceae bacterium]